MISSKNCFIAALLLFVAFFSGCSDEDEARVAPAGNFSIFSNPTGFSGADALQALYENSGESVHFYGSFGVDDRPEDVRTLVYRQPGNDTLVNIVFDDISRRVSAVFFTVNGQRLAQMMKFTYMDVASMVNVAVYQCDWASLNFEEIVSVNAVVDPSVLADNRLSGQSGADAFFDNLNTISQSLLIGVVVVEVVVPVLAGIGAVLAPVLTPVLMVGGAFLATSLIIDLIVSNEAQAAQYESSYPENVAVQNPAPDNVENAVDAPDCAQVQIEFDASMDSEGTIMISGAQGGTAPYSFLLGGTSGFADVGIYAQKPNGSYVVSVRDANGCIGAKVVTLARPCDIAVSASSSGSSATASVQGGTPPFAYHWSHGATTPSVSGLSEGIYTLTVTDANGCGATTTVTVGNPDAHFLTGTWTVTADRFDDEDWSPAGVWVNYYSAECPGVLSVKEKIIGTAVFTQNTYDIQMSLEWVSYNVNAECGSSGPDPGNGFAHRWGGFLPNLVTVNGQQRYNAINANSEDGDETWEVQDAHFRVVDENTVIYREFEYENVYYNIKMVRE